MKENNYQYNNTGYGYSSQGGGAPTYGYGQAPPTGGVPTYGYGQAPPTGGVPTYGYGQAPPTGGVPTYDYGQAPPTGGVPIYGYGQPTAQYPEALPASAVFESPPVDGKPLYNPEETAGEPNLNRFVKQGYKDIWAAVLFLILFIVTIVWGVVNIITFSPISSDGHTNSDKKLNVKTLSRPLIIRITIIVAICSGFCVVLSLIFIYLMRCAPKVFIYVANLLNTALLISISVYAAKEKIWVVCVLMGLMSIISLLFLFCARKRIPFAAALLRTSANIVLNYKTIFLVNILTAITIFVYTFVGLFMIVPSIDRVYHKRKKNYDLPIIFVFIFAFYWASSVFGNVMHVTASGLVATWYFAGFDSMPSNPTLASFTRAVTTSFGSICFGSLLVAIIEFIRELANSLRSEDSFLACILDCILACIEGMLKYFNTYAFVHVAIYGCGYIDAARRTFQLFSHCIFKALVNDCFVNPTLKMSSFGVSVVLGVASGLVDWNVVTGVIAFIVSFLISSMLFSPIGSAVVTIFVCFSEVPEALERSDPSLYKEIRDADAELNQNV